MKTLQATQIELSQDQRQKFLLAFKEHTSNYEMFKGWFFIHEVYVSLAGHDAMDEGARKEAWKSWIEGLEIEEELDSWITVLKYDFSVCDQVYSIHMRVLI